MGGGRTHDHGQLLARRCGLTGRRLAPPFFEPAPVRASAREPQFDRIVLLEAALGIDGEHLPRPEPSPTSTRPDRRVEDAGFGRAADEIAGDDVAKGPQAVAVESGADDPAVRKDDA